jgi:hypothetical protein
MRFSQTFYNRPGRDGFIAGPAGTGPQSSEYLNEFKIPGFTNGQGYLVSLDDNYSGRPMIYNPWLHVFLVYIGLGPISSAITVLTMPGTMVDTNSNRYNKLRLRKILVS